MRVTHRQGALRGATALLMAALALLTGCALTSAGSSGGTTHRVTYEVTGQARQGVDVTYNTETGDTAQDNGYVVPWRRSFTMSDGDFLYVSAQNQGAGTVHCAVYIDGVLAESNDGNGAYAICTASGTL